MEQDEQVHAPDLEERGEVPMQSLGTIVDTDVDSITDTLPKMENIWRYLFHKVANTSLESTRMTMALLIAKGHGSHTMEEIVTRIFLNTGVISFLSNFVHQLYDAFSRVSGDNSF